MADRVKNALVAVLGVDAAEDFSLEDIDLLERQGYRSDRSLATATRDGLRHIHLPEARIDAIMTATGESLQRSVRAWDHAMSPCGS